MKCILLFFLVFGWLQADVELKNINTSLYSKLGNDQLKDVSISLDFEGTNLNKNKLLDATNSVIAAFFYEDIFTELGKNAFKKTLIRVLDKKYNQKVDAIYILRLSHSYKYDTKDLKEFLKTQLKDDLNDLKRPSNPSRPNITPPSTPTPVQKPELHTPTMPPKQKIEQNFVVKKPLKPKNNYQNDDYFKDAPNLPKAKDNSSLTKLPSAKFGNIPDADTIKKDADTMRKLILAREKMLKEKKQMSKQKGSKKRLSMPFDKGRNLNAAPIERGSLPASQELLLKQMKELNQISPNDNSIQDKLNKIKEQIGVGLKVD